MHSSAFAGSELIPLLHGWQVRSGAERASSAPETRRPILDQADVAHRLSGWLRPWDAEHLHASLSVIEAHDRKGAFEEPTGVGRDPIGVVVDRVESHRQALLARWTDRAHRPTWDWTQGVQTWYGECQAEMNRWITEVRTLVRRVLAQGSARQRKLAALDALMERHLASREQRVWSELGRHLARRVTEDAWQSVPPPAEALADALCLLAEELAARLQPVWGMLEAAGEE